LVKLNVEVDDWDTSESITLTLPCDVKNRIDTTHDLQIIDWDGDFSLGYYDDVVELNDLIEDINAENSLMTLDILIGILNSSGCGDLSNKDFIRKICESDFMLEDITNSHGRTDEEKCALYLASEMMIPFAQNISYSILENLNDRNVLWERVWKYYSKMGFQIITINKKQYAFHWGDAVEE